MTTANTADNKGQQLDEIKVWDDFLSQPADKAGAAPEAPVKSNDTLAAEISANRVSLATIAENVRRQSTELDATKPSVATTTLQESQPNQTSSYKLQESLRHNMNEVNLAKATFTHADRPGESLDVKQFGGFGSVIPAQQIKIEKQPEDVGLNQEGIELLKTVQNGGVPAFITSHVRRIAESNGIEILSTDTPQDVFDRLKAKLPQKEVTPTPDIVEVTPLPQESVVNQESLKQKEGLLRTKKELLTETILKNNQLMKSLKKTEKDISDVLKNAELSDSDRESTLQSIREKIKTLEMERDSAEAQLASTTKDHTDVLAQLASKQESVQTQQSETKGNAATVEASSLLFSREGLTDFQKKIADQESVAGLFALLASPEYKHHQFGSGTRKESGVQLAQRISEYILQAKTGDKASPRFFIPDAIIAGKVQELLEKSSSWKKGRDSFGMDVFEKVESDPTMQDAQVGKAVAETIEKVRKETHPGWFARVGSWFKEAAKPTREKAVGVGVAGVFGSLLLALGLWAGNGQDNKKTEGAPANADNTSESAEQGPSTPKGNHSLYNPGTQESQPTTNTQEKEALRAAQDAVTKVYAEQGKVAFDEGDTKVFTGEEVVADGPATEINPESTKPRNLMERIGNPLDKGIGDIRIANGTVYVEPRGQVAYIEAPTPKTYWAQAVINDALNYNVQSRNGSMDAENANQWAKGPLRNVFERYEREDNVEKNTGSLYTNEELLFLRNAFVELQKKIASVAQNTKTLSPELEKVALIIQEIDGRLSGQY